MSDFLFGLFLMEKIFREIYQLSQKGIFENKIIVFNLFI